MPPFFAGGVMAKLVRIGKACVVLNLVLNLLLMRPLQHIGPALATSLSAVVNTVWLEFALARRGYFRPDRPLLRRLASMAAATALMAGVLALTQPKIFALAGERGLKWLTLTVLVGIGRTVYAAAGQALGAFDVRDALQMLARRK